MNKTKHERAVTVFGGCQNSLLRLAATKSLFITGNTVVLISKRDGLDGGECERKLKDGKEFEMSFTGDLYLSFKLWVAGKCRSATVTSFPFVLLEC